MNKLLPKPSKVIDFQRETFDNFTITLDAKMKHEPGQFVQVSLLGFGEAPISIASHSDKYIKLNIHEVGNVTNALAKLKKGDKVFIKGPYGKGYPMKKLKGNDIIIIGGGCGVAPLKGVIDYIGQNRSNYNNVMLFLGFRTPDDILFNKELKKWRKDYHVNVSVDKDPKKTCYDFNVGFITEMLEKTDLNNNNKVVFLCGPPIMINKVIEILKNKGFNDNQMFVSNERLMFCGIGMCCHCMIRGKLTCLDGPVFRYDEINKYEND
ncbi:FAD/NAD(P)-binding protein [Candidatus Woesearchaeota archaeon]|nr:FAD/NAD(P)-binding protein [Candidatus Woesearchaeota archaeon]